MVCDAGIGIRSESIIFNMTTHTIPTNFRVPKGFRHRWLVYGSTGELLQEIQGVPGQRKIKTISHDASHECKTTTSGSLGLDWMAETVEHMRWLCQGGKL